MVFSRIDPTFASSAWSLLSFYRLLPNVCHSHLSRFFIQCPLLFVCFVLCSLFLFLPWSNSPFPNLLLLLLPSMLLFTLATHLSPSIRPSSGHPAITLHYRHIQHTNFTQNSTWVPPGSAPIGRHKNLLSSHWSTLHVDLPPDSEMIIFYNVTYLCWKWLHPMVFWGMRPPFGAGDGCIQWGLLYNWTAP